MAPPSKIPVSIIPGIIEFTLIRLAAKSSAIPFMMPFNAPFDALYADPPINEQLTPDMEDIKTMEALLIMSFFRIKKLVRSVGP